MHVQSDGFSFRFIFMASAPINIEEISQTFKQLILSGVRSKGRELGRGAYGRVYTVKYRGVVYAAKEVHALLLELAGAEEAQTLRNNFIRECSQCSKLNHVNVVPLVGIYYPSKQSLPVMIMELMDTSLTAYATQPDVSLKRKLSILHDVAEGLSYLHNNQVIHRDLSPNNVLIKYSGVDQVPPIAKIADLGVAKMIQVDSKMTKSQLTKIPGTVDFMPPEAFEDNPHYNTSLDVFSYGGVMLYTVNGKWPTPTAQVERNPYTNELRALSEVERRQQYLDEMTGQEVEVLVPLIRDCLNNDPAKRPSIIDLSSKIISLKESPPLVLMLQSGLFKLTWEKCADLPAPMYYPSAVLHNDKVHVMAGSAPDRDTYRCVFTYSITSNHWDRLPPPGHAGGVLEIIDGKVSVIGGMDTYTGEATNKVSTLINNSWTKYYPDMSTPRFRPGVASYSDYIIVAGGRRDVRNKTSNKDIELLYYKQSPQWVRTNINLPEPMCFISLTISNNLLYIVGYGISTGRTYKAYQIEVDKITSSVTQPSTSSQWTTIPSAPHYGTTIIPNSCPPVIIGGCSMQYVPTADVAMLKESWNKVGSLSSPRYAVAVVSINYESILVIGGTTGGNTTEERKIHSTTTVEKGKVKQRHTITAIPTQDRDSQCIIQ